MTVRRNYVGVVKSSLAPIISLFPKPYNCFTFSLCILLNQFNKVIVPDVDSDSIVSGTTSLVSSLH